MRGSLPQGTWITVLCAAQLGTMLVYSNFNAVLPILQREWGLSNTQAGLIVAAYGVGYILAVVILSTLTDWVEPRRIYLAGALWAGLAGLAFAFWAHGFLSALCWRTLGGIGLAGTYMPGMRMVAERFETTRRGFAMGWYIATFTVGTSVSLLVTSWAMGLWGWRIAFALTALGPLLAFVVAALALPPGTVTTAVRGQGAGGFAPVLKNRPALLLIVAYGAHAWELMGMRGWIVPFLTASLTAAGAGLAEATRNAGLASSAILAIGAIPHPVAGFWSDRWGRARLISGIMLISGICSLGIGWALSWPFWALVLLGLFYGLIVTAESSILSTSIAETAEPAYLGRTMALQSAVGFTAGALAPAAFGAVLDLAAKFGATADQAWGWAFTLLGIGVLAGPLAVGLKKPSRKGQPRMKRLRVGIIFGGRSGEHEVSLASAASVLHATDRTRFEPVAIGIAKDGRWLIGGEPLRALAQSAGITLALPDAIAEPSEALQQVDAAGGLPVGLSNRLDVVFPLIHGPFGEDGTLQGLLELADLPYVGAGVMASAVGMDKAVQKAVFRAHGIPVAEHLVVLWSQWEREPEAVKAQVTAAIGFPCFVKPANLGSSVGVSKVKSPDELPEAIGLAGRYDRRLLIERAAAAREIEVSVLGNDDPQASVPGEVVPEKEWYDYEAKYTPGLTRFLIPAPLSPTETDSVRELAVKAYAAIDCCGMARVDFFFDGDRFILNELNTIPGFTATSAYPRLWEASGLPYPALISRLIELAIERHAAKRR